MITKGYKATDAHMCCRDHKFELGVWYEIDGDIALCERGFHFCVHPSGVWSYYSEPGTRVFEVEVEDVLETPDTPGADLKKVCRRIRLVREIIGDGDGNTGNQNTGNQNTGSWNTGSWNTGSWNTGNQNTGYGNTGDGNCCNYSSGFFCAAEPKAISFDEPTDFTVSEYQKLFGSLIYDLSVGLHKADEIDFDKFAALPNITSEKLRDLHAKHLEAKK